MSDRERAYRTRDEEQQWQQNDPIAGLVRHILENNHATQAELDRIVEETKQEIVTAIEFAKAAPLPHPDEVTQHVYAN
jgi:TPP-dependent pyruvate/acetoin dehydrogenase alpha subunit